MYVIIGGAGFLGSNLAAGIEKAGLGEISVVDNFETDERWRNIAKRNLRSIVAPRDLFEYLNSHNEQIDAIIHINYTGVTKEASVDDLIEERIILTWKLWCWCSENRVPYIYDSTSGVYGDGSQGFKDDDSLEALLKLQPLNPAAWTKLMIDRKIATNIAEGKKAPPQWIGFRCFNLYGPNEYHTTNHRSVVPGIYQAAKSGKLFPLFKSENPDYKDGEQLRDFIWVDDCVDIIIYFLQHPEISGIFNIGTGEARTYKDVLTCVYNAIGEKPELDFIDMPKDLRTHYQYYTKADVTKLRQVGYDKPFTSLEEGVSKYVHDYLEKTDMYR
ncbi:MAG: ADP-glyceromanno-heptose 6-epimerase [Alphaproteobacteria bacterium]|nr:ADP-glyceromanno-heptose 6-epimerase [Alphaproteobacteria bacterium]